MKKDWNEMTKLERLCAIIDEEEEARENAKKNEEEDKEKAE